MHGLTTRLATTTIAGIAALLPIDAAVTVYAAAPSHLAVSPTAAPAGTVVRITGTIPLAQRQQYLQPPTLVFMDRRTHGGDLVLGAHAHVSVDGHGRLLASFAVPTHGTFNAGIPDSRVHPTDPGRYAVAFPCHACTIGTFTVTAGSGDRTLPFTGASTHMLALLASAVISLGAGLLFAVRRRTRHNTP